jgi:hypothetical protein
MPANELRIYWRDAQGDMDYVQQEYFQDLLYERGLKLFEATERIIDIYQWIIKEPDKSIIMFEDPEDGMYMYAFRGTKKELKRIIDDSKSKALELE